MRQTVTAVLIAAVLGACAAVDDLAHLGSRDARRGDAIALRDLHCPPGRGLCRCGQHGFGHGCAGRRAVFARPGRSFEWSAGLGPGGPILAIEADRQGRIVAVTEYGDVLVTADGGSNWRSMHKISFSGPTSLYKAGIAFLGEGVIVVLPGRGLVLRSADGGETWQRIVGGALTNLQHYETHCSDGHGLLVVAGYGAAIRSVDGGVSWQAVQVD